MDRKAVFHRRQVSTGLAAAVALPLAGRLPGASVLAQTAGGAWERLSELTAEAQRLGLSAPRTSLMPSRGGDAFDETMPALIDFMDSVEASAPETREVAPADVESLLERASQILRELRNAERPSREILEDVETREALRAAPPALETIADEYRQRFATCQINDSKRSEVLWYASKVTDASRRAAYGKVYEETCVPWYVVAITHGMEASFDMQAHIHNGDPLKKKTVQVPKGRPEPWNPPSDWASSAIDAMRYDKLDEKPDWLLANMLYRWESYNGWSSRLRHGIATPYLWSFSNHYTKGKYVADGVWDPNAVSKQCGAAVMLKALVESGAVALPA